MDIEQAKKRLQQRIATMDKLRGRPLTAGEQITNLREALAEHDSDCLSRKGLDCDCGADAFRGDD